MTKNKVVAMNLPGLEKTNCIQCKRETYKNNTMDGICSKCWNKKPKFFVVPKNQ